MPSEEAVRTASFLLLLAARNSLFGAALRVLRQPAVRGGFTDVFDLAGVDGVAGNFHLALRREVGTGL